MPTSITDAQKAAKLVALSHGIQDLTHGDYASLANAVHTMGPIGDTHWATRDYFRRNHKEIELTEEMVAEIAEATYVGLYGYKQTKRVNKG